MKIVSDVIRLSSAFHRAFSPTADLLHTLKACGVNAPKSEFPAVRIDQIPCFAARHFIGSFYASACPVRSRFNNAIVDSREISDTVFLDEITGCLNSKSGMTNFDWMRDLGTVRYHVQTYRDNVETLAKRVFEGSFDCAVHEGENADIIQQEWDGRKWIANSGGSHRSAAIREIDLENGYRRVLKSDIRVYGLSEDFKSLCDDYTILVFNPSSIIPLADRMAELRKSGLILGRQNVNFSSHEADWCLILPKGYKDHDRVLDAVPGAFDLSRWSEDPSAFRNLEKEPCTPETGKIRPLAHASFSI